MVGHYVYSDTAGKNHAFVLLEPVYVTLLKKTPVFFLF